jgi:hypothetical protein
LNFERGAGLRGTLKGELVKAVQEVELEEEQVSDWVCKGNR